MEPRPCSGPAMEMQQIRYFLALARTLNFTRAAEECNVTQPALTRAIQAQSQAKYGWGDGLVVELTSD